jgi:hypothetical protein
MDELAAFPNEIRANDAAQKLRNSPWVTSKVIVYPKNVGCYDVEGRIRPGRTTRAWVVALIVPAAAGCHTLQFIERARMALFSNSQPEVLSA